MKHSEDQALSNPASLLASMLGQILEQSLISDS